MKHKQIIKEITKAEIDKTFVVNKIEQLKIEVVRLDNLLDKLYGFIK